MQQHQRLVSTALFALATFACGAAFAVDSDNPQPGPAARTEAAVVRGAHAAASGVEYGAKAAASGVERGAKATARVTRKGVSAAASGVGRGAKATGDAAENVARKVSPGASSSSN